MQSLAEAKKTTIFKTVQPPFRKYLLKNKNIELCTNGYNRCLTFVATLQRLTPLVTNARICVALYHSNTQKRNAYLIVGKGACNA
jgi:hypothetical protein